jgi:NitT/TauT family transport system substrate-binding protein
MIKKLVVAAIAAVLASLALPAAAQQAKPMRLTLNFLAGGPQAGFMLAKKLGYYKDVGIDLTIEEANGSATPAQQVATGQTDLCFADAPAAMQIRSKGAPLKIIAPILQTNGFAIISIEGSGIKSPKDLVGKKLAVQPGTAQTTLLDAILAENKLDKAKLDIVNIDPAALVGALLEKKVDAILAGADFQSVQMRDRGFKVNDIFYRDVGVPTVGLSIVARDDRLKESPDLYRNFVAASSRAGTKRERTPTPRRRR